MDMYVYVYIYICMFGLHYALVCSVCNVCTCSMCSVLTCSRELVRCARNFVACVICLLLRQQLRSLRWQM